MSLTYPERRVDQYFTYPPYLNLNFSLNANQYRTENRPCTAQSTTGTSIRFDANGRGEQLADDRSRSGARVSSTRSSRSETVAEAGPLRHTWTMLDWNLFAGDPARDAGEISSVKQFIHFGVVRRF